MNSGALAYNAGPLSDVKPLVRKKTSLKSLWELNSKKNFLRWKPPRNKRPRYLVGNSSAQPAKLSTNAELLA
jgi:hypothetical protein